jgi:hypothetical protein|tara:strand:+ start:454 stop:702 length:249 start_codon:yes stop_codon:yes gene_type:complete
MKVKHMKKYLMDNYGRVDHDMEKMHNSCVKLSELYDVDSKDIFLFMVENQEIESLHTHSYGFNTREGRALKEVFQSYYYAEN